MALPIIVMLSHHRQILCVWIAIDDVRESRASRPIHEHMKLYQETHLVDFTFTQPSVALYFAMEINQKNNKIQKCL